MATQTTLHPFKSYQADPTVHVVSDGIGNEIVLPKYGCLSWIEDDIINTYIINADTDKNGQKLPMSYAEAELVSKLMQFRKGIKPDQFQPKEEVLVIPCKDGSTRPMSSLLVHAIYEYFTVCEKSGWKQSSDAVVAPSPEQQAELNATAANTSEKK